MSVFKKITLILGLLAGVAFTSHAQCTTFTSTVPYLENFSGTSPTNTLPACWAVSNSVTCYAIYGQYAMFYGTPPDTNYYYTNGIYFNAGSVYSITANYRVTSVNHPNWTNFAFFLGTSQSTTGLAPVASTSIYPGTALSRLSNTFAVSSSGIYYVAVRGVCTSTCCAAFMYWDNLSITEFCSGFNLSASPPSICKGDQALLSVSGTDTYSWNTGHVTSSIIVSPTVNTTYTFSGSSSTNNCLASGTIQIVVNPTPAVSIGAFNSVICAGKTIDLFAYGTASAFFWSTGSGNSSVSVQPPVSTTYSLTGINSFGCLRTATLAIIVNPLPNLTIMGSKSKLCEGETIYFNADGAVHYLWSVGSNTIFGQEITQTVLASEPTYSLAGTGANGCSSSTFVTLQVNKCTGLEDNSRGDNAFSVFPNPGKNRISIRTGFYIKTLELFAITGSCVLSQSNIDRSTDLEIPDLPQGIYYLRLYAADRIHCTKIIKQ